MKKQYFSLFVISLLFSLQTSAQWVQTDGPYSGTRINALATDGSILFTATENSGVYSSSDFGSTWNMASSGLAIYPFNCLLFNGSSLFVAGDNGFYRSTNNGTSWTQLNISGFYYPSSLVINGSTLIACTNGGLYRSTDNGSNWTLVSGIIANANLAVVGSNFIAASSGGVYRSTNDGVTWTSVNAAQTNIITMKASGSNLYAGTTSASVGVGAGILLSTDNGTTWITRNTGFTGSNVTSLLFNGTDIYCGASTGGLFLSTNSASSWSNVSGTSSYKISCMTLMGATIFLGTSDAGIYSSNNFGISWVPSYNGLITSDIRALAFNGSNLFAGSDDGYGAYITSSNGANWTSVNSGLTVLGKIVNAITSIGINTFIGTNDGVFHSTNNGATWTPVNTGLPVGIDVNELVVIGTNLFAGTNGSGVYMSTNNGTSWTAVNTGLTDLTVTAMTTNGTNLFAGTDNSGVFLSTNNGTSWTAVNNGIPTNWTYSLSSAGGTVYLCDGFSSPLYKTTNNGTSWTAINSGISGFIYSIYANGSYLFAFSYSGMYFSTNSGSTWTNIQTGLPVINRYGMAINGNTVYVGTTGLGVWKRNLDEILCSINPPIMTSASSATICSGSAINIPLTNSGVAATYTWIASDNFQTIGESTTLQTTSTINNTITNSSNLNATTLTYTVTPIGISGGCIGSTQTVTVTINPKPVMTSSSTVTVCSRQSVGLNLLSSVSCSYTWIASDNFNTTGESTSTQSSVTINDVITNNTANFQVITYTVTPMSTGGSCIGTTQTISVTVNPAPSMTSSSGATICSGSTVTIALASNINSNYIWNAYNNVNTSGESVSTQFDDTLSDIITNNTSNTQYVTYIVTPTSQVGGCSGIPQTVTVTVHPEPVIISSTNAAICSGNALNLSLVSNIPSTYGWIATDNVNTTGESLTTQTGNTITNTILNNSSFVQNVLYTVTPTSLDGCVGGNQTISVLVNPLDNASFSYSSSTFCKTGANPSAIITGLSGGYFSSTSGLVFANPYSGLINLSSSTVGTYTVTYTTNNVCPNTATFSITITTAPSASFSYTGSPYCSGATNPLPTFGAGASGGVFSANPAGIAFISTVTGEINLTTSAPGTYTITNYIAASGGCASDVATSTFIINPLPVVNLTGLATNYYYNDPAVTLVGSPSGGTFSGTAVSANSFSPSVAGGGTFPVTYTYTDLNGCTNSDSDTTIVLAQPAPPDICEVTVDSASIYNNIYWDKTNYTNVDSFIVYREITSNVYKRIGALKDTALSLFIDTVRTLYTPNTGDPNTGTYRYKLQIRDSLGNYSPLSPYHNTIYINKSFGIFSWIDHYGIEGQSNPLPSNILITYDLYCDDLSNGNWHIVNSVAGTQKVIGDPNWTPALDNTASWRVLTNWTIGCTPTRGSIVTSRSNIKKSPVVSVQDYSEFDSSVSIYPNPTTDVVTIEILNSNWHNSTVKLYNVIGEIIYQTIISNTHTVIDISSFTKGIYYIEFENNGIREFKKLVIQ